MTMDQHTGRATSHSRSRELRIAAGKRVTTYLIHAFPLSVILADDRYLPWFFERFVQLTSAWGDWGSGRQLVADYADQHDVYREMLLEMRLNRALAARCGDILDLIRDGIDDGYYAIVFLDEYHLPGKIAHGEIHFVHESLVYGYDDAMRTVKALGFDQDAMFGPLTLGYDAVRTAFDAAIRPMDRDDAGERSRRAPDAEMVVLLKLKPWLIDPYPFDVSRFAVRVRDYTDSRVDGAGMYLRFGVDWSREASGNAEDFRHPGDAARAGLALYDDVAEHVANARHGCGTMDYRIFHLLAEHKRGMYERLSFVAARYGGGDRLQTLMHEYESTVKQWETIRLHALRYGFGEHEPAVAETLAQALTLARDDERMVMQSLATELERIADAHGHSSEGRPILGP